MISFNFHLLTFKNTLTLPDGEEVIYEFKSKGGRLFLIWIILRYILFAMDKIETFKIFPNILIGLGIAVLWDIITAALYILKIKIITKKLRKQYEDEENFRF